MSNSLLWFAGLLLVFYFVRQVLTGVGAISPTEAKAMLDGSKDVQLVDVRTPQEFAVGHLHQARNIPLDRLEGSLSALKQGKPLLVYCHSGARSSAALSILKRSGFPEAKHMRGGISAWRSSGYPVQ